MTRVSAEESSCECYLALPPEIGEEDAIAQGEEIFSGRLNVTQDELFAFLGNNVVDEAQLEAIG